MSDIETGMDAIQTADTAPDQQKPYDLRAALEAEASRQMSEQGENAEEGEDLRERDESRDELGRFKKKEEPQEPETGAEEPKPKDEGEKPAEQNADPAAESPSRAPGGWSVASKAEWDKLPEAVRADIAKREHEVNEGFKQYSGLKDVIPYQQHYAQQGSSVKQALDSYTALDSAFVKNPVGTVAFMAEQRGVNPVHMAYAILQQAGIQIPDQQGQPQAHQQQVFKDPRVDQILRAQEEERRNRELAEQQQVSQTIEQFAADPKNTFFENVKVTMGHLINTGEASDLADAYEKACLLNPEIRPLLIKQQAAAQAQTSQAQRQAAAAAQARQSAKSLTGSPAPGGSSANRSKPLTIRETLVEAARAQGVSV